MEPTTTVEEQPIASALEEASAIVEEVSNYSALITDSLYIIFGGMIAVFLLYKLTSKFLFPYVKNKRLLKVVFGTIYVLILVVTMLVVLDKIGIDTSMIGRVAILVVLAGAVLVFFLVPFLPRLPFMLGQMINVNGVVGTVDNISPVHTTIRTFDGAMVFIPNPVVLASKIINFSDIPERRIAFNLTISLDSDIEKIRGLVLTIMNADERVLKDPEPLIRAATASAIGISLTALCWVKNDDFLNAQSDLWLQMMDAFKQDDSIALALPQQEVHIINDTGVPERRKIK